MIRRLLRLLGLLGLAGAAAHAQYATLTGVLQAANGLPALNYTLSFTINQWGFIGGTGVVVNTTTYCGTDSTTGAVVGITAPTSPTINTPSYSGGSLPAGNYFVVFTWYNAAGGITQISPESTAQLTATGNLQVAPPSSGLPAGAVGMNVYIGTTSAGETYQGQTTGSGVYTQSVVLVSGSSPPSSNTTICKQVANDAIWPIGTGYTVSMTDPSGNTLPGYPMMWQLLGPNTTINLSYGLPYYHGVVTFPAPILASPQNHATQSISGGLSLGNYYLYARGLVPSTGAPPTGDCLASDGYAYDTPVMCTAAANQTIAINGTAQTQRPTLNFYKYFTNTDTSSPPRSTIGLITTGPAAQLVTSAAPGSSTGCAQYDGAGNIAPLANPCLTVIPASQSSNLAGSSRLSGVTYTNGGAPTMVEVTGEEISGASGDGFCLTAVSAAATVQQQCQLLNDYSPYAGYTSVSFLVPAGAQYSVTLVNYGTTTTPTIISWYEVTM